MAEKVETRRASGRPGFRNHASEQPAHPLRNADCLLFQPDGRDYPRWDGVVGEPAEPDSSITGKLAEIKRRYRWAERQEELRRPTSWLDINPNKRRKELRILRGIWDRAGRSTVEIDKAIRDNGWPELDGRDLGRIIDFTFADYQAYHRFAGRHPSTVRPKDMTQAEIADYLRGFHRPRKREALRKRRAEQAEKRQLAGDLDCRSSAILTVLTDTSRPIRLIMKDLKGSNAFRKPDDKPLTGNSLRKAILAKLRSHQLADKIETTSVFEKHGKNMFLIRRRPK